MPSAQHDLLIGYGPPGTSYAKSTYSIAGAAEAGVRDAVATFRESASRRERGSSTTESYDTTVDFRVFADTDTRAQAGARAIREAVVPQGQPAASWAWLGGRSVPAVLLTPGMPEKSPRIGPSGNPPTSVHVRFQVRELRAK